MLALVILVAVVTIIVAVWALVERRGAVRSTPAGIDYNAAPQPRT
ncbi:MAG: hypothetical protein JWM38_1232 [Sphingomonas bacterium]|jgi:hypothetical protein|nr:hypothetical protein [Sphingomonas bacterium]MDB5684219.1 hypothetical protein [Sphingomonas bacterium]MDB5717805.1 hypothetical protein [Sphingomonas bacterium]